MTERPRIAHVCADHGVEAGVLGLYGDVVRLGLDPRDTNDSHPVAGDVRQVPFRDGAFDLAVMHPPCTRWSDMPDADKAGEAPNLIPECRRAGARIADHYVIENVPRAPLDDPVVLDGDMFALPIKYARAFEASFPIPEPPRYARFDNESSSYFYSERSRAWWAAVKGVHPDRYTKRALCKNALPAPYVHHIVRAWLDATGRADGPADYTEYDRCKTAERRREKNHDLLSAVGGDAGD